MGKNLVEILEIREDISRGCCLSRIDCPSLAAGASPE